MGPAHVGGERAGVRGKKVTAARRVAVALLALDALLIAAYLATHLPGYGLDILSVALERSIPNWYSSAKLLVLAQLLGYLAWVTPVPAWRTRGWANLVMLAPVAFFLLLSLEEVAALHERLEPRAEALVGGSDGYWPVLAGLALAAVMTIAGVAYVRLARPPLAALGKAAAGAVAFVGGAAATDFVNNMLQDGRGLVLGSALEEGLELVGITLLVWAVLEVVAARPGRPSPAFAGRLSGFRARSDAPRDTLAFARHAPVRLGRAAIPVRT